MGVCMELTKAFLDAKDFKYMEITTKSKEALLLRMASDVVKLEIVVVFIDDVNVTLHCRKFCHIPDDKLEECYELCSDLNCSFRWVKFYVDEEDNTIRAEDDAVIKPENVGEEVYELVGRMTSVISNAYPKIMHMIYA